MNIPSWLKILWIKFIWSKCLRKRKFKAELLKKKIEKKLGPPRCVSYERQLWKTGQKSSLSLITWSGLAPSARLGCFVKWPRWLGSYDHVIIQSWCLLRLTKAHRSRSQSGKQRVSSCKIQPWASLNGNDRLQRGNSLLWSLMVTGHLTQHALTGVNFFY